MFFAERSGGARRLLSKKEIESGLHASLAETSLMLALKPQLVVSVQMKFMKERSLKVGVWKEMRQLRLTEV